MNLRITGSGEGMAATLSGSLTFAAHQTFRRMVEEHIEQPGGDLVIDLAGVDYIDSAGLGMLLLAREAAEKRNRPITLRGARDQVARMIAVSRFDTLFTIQP